MADPLIQFFAAATVARHAHTAGTCEEADRLLAQHPQVADSLYAAAILGDEAAVAQFLDHDPAGATAPGGPYGWDALTYLCFSRYLRLEPHRGFAATAKRLLDAGASAQTGWNDDVFESAIYGAAAVARHVELTRLLLDHGADPNDDETPYHVPETWDNTILEMLLTSGKLNAVSLSWMLLRKTDWHDLEGLRLLLTHGADPNRPTRFGGNAFHHAIRRDNRIEAIDLLLDHGANPSLIAERDGRSATALAARRGRADILRSLRRRGIPLQLEAPDRQIAACALDDREQMPEKLNVGAEGGMLLAEFAGTGNVLGVRNLLHRGIAVNALYREGDPYFDIAKNSTALHVAAWRAWPDVVQELIAQGAPVNVLDDKGRSPLKLAVKACVDSYWTHRRTPASVRSLLQAGASTTGIKIPCGYDEVDNLLLSK